MKNMFLILTIAFVLGTACQALAEYADKPAQEGETDQAVNVGNKICPVSGAKIGEGGMKPATYEYQGKVYNFCCPMCIEEFKKDPEKYINKVNEELKSGQSQAPVSGEGERR